MSQRIGADLSHVIRSRDWDISDSDGPPRDLRANIAGSITSAVASPMSDVHARAKN